LYEVSDDVIEVVASDKMIIVNRGKQANVLSDEWEKTKIIDFK
jgi:hypothetical protein